MLNGKKGAAGFEFGLCRLSAVKLGFIGQFGKRFEAMPPNCGIAAKNFRGFVAGKAELFRK